jgi:competence protein ComEA
MWNGIREQLPPIIAVAATIAVARVDCRGDDLFPPDPLHHSLLSSYLRESALDRTLWEPEFVCVRSDTPLCECEPADLDRMVTGLAPEQRVDLSLATADELRALPGIGPGLAARIITYRELNGFSRVDDLMRVAGIGRGRFARIRSLVMIPSRP